MKKRKILLKFALILCALTHVSMLEIHLNDIYGILDREDYLLMEQQKQPALHSAAGENLAWESFNSWSCFPTTELEIDCRDQESDQSWHSISSEERNGKGYYAVIDVKHEGHQYRFQSPGWILEENCLQQIESTMRLLDGQIGFCIFAAKIPSDEELNGTNDESASLWATYGIKSLAGRFKHLTELKPCSRCRVEVDFGRGAIAQLVERCIRIAKAVGSTPISSTKSKPVSKLWAEYDLLFPCPLSQ